MTYNNNNFIRKNTSSIHESLSQNIQGGSAGEHYHLTAAELANVQTIPNLTARLAVVEIAIAKPIYEPVMVSGELALTNSGDLLMAIG